MTKTTASPNTLSAWHTLETLAAGGKQLDLMSLFQNDPDRHRRFALSVDGLLLDYSKNLIDEPIFAALLALAEQSTLRQQRDTLFNGGLVNSSEQRAALHTALRGEREDGYQCGGEALDEQISATLAEMAAISRSIREGTISFISASAARYSAPSWPARHCAPTGTRICGFTLSPTWMARMYSTPSTNWILNEHW